MTHRGAGAHGAKVALLRRPGELSDARTLKGHRAQERIRQLDSAVAGHVQSGGGGCRFRAIQGRSKGDESADSAPEHLAKSGASGLPSDLIAEMSDEVAQAIVYCAIAFGNETSKWSRCKELLRSTQSPVLFRQQIGRGLRLAPGKESCLVFDFVGQHRTEFRFDRLLSSMTRRERLDSVENGFGSLPPGCHIHLQRQTREQVLQGLRALTTQNWRRLKTELQPYAALRGRSSVRLADFLHDQALELEDVYRTGTGQSRSGWTALKRDSGLIAAEPAPKRTTSSRRMVIVVDISAVFSCTQHHALLPGGQGTTQEGKDSRSTNVRSGV